MESILTAAVAIFILIFGILTMSAASLEAQDSIQESWREMETRMDAQMRTDLTPVDSQVSADGSTLTVVLRNEGDTSLIDYEHWDAIVQYYGDASKYYVHWLSYAETLPSFENKWAVAGIYADAEAAISEIYEPEILNPGEEIVLQVGFSPAVGDETTNMLVLVTDNGTRTTVMFSNEG